MKDFRLLFSSERTNVTPELWFGDETLSYFMCVSNNDNNVSVFIEYSHAIIF